MGVKIEKMIKDLNLEVILRGNPEEEIKLSDINRPGLQFAGYYDYFAYRRLQVLGRMEMSYLGTLTAEVRRERLEKFFEFDIPCAIIARKSEPFSELIETASKSNIWVLRSEKVTSRIINKIMNYLDKELAESTMLHGELVNVYGIGILITGESGIGKSEIALELIKRGHMLVSDDAVEVKSIDGELHGRSPYITYGMLEVRGMGIIDVAALYGLSSITIEKTINFVVELEEWDGKKEYDRLGASNERMDILGIPVKKIRLPIKPGRNVAVIIEAAAANYRHGLVSSESAVEIIERRMNEASQHE